MNGKISCTLYCSKKTATQHLKQIFTGFFELEKKGFIDVQVKLNDWLPRFDIQNLLMVIIDNKYRVIYDVSDGFNWISADTTENLEFFQENLSGEADFYFKRSFNEELLAYSGNRCKIHPLGLNYMVTTRANKVDGIQFDFKSWIKYRLSINEWLSRKLKSENRTQFELNKFEYLPLSQNKDPKILLLTRIWDPGKLQKYKVGDAKLYENKVNELLEINDVRSKSIIECRKLFGKRFTGGVYRDNYSLQKYPELVMPENVTSKANFMKAVKESDICIATTGLHKSIGWRLAEYVAAARAIVTEKLHYSLPGDFSAPTNYLEFKDVKQLIDNVNLLIGNKQILREMMLNNYQYYNLYVKPDNLLLNTLLIVKAKGEV